MMWGQTVRSGYDIGERPKPICLIGQNVRREIHALVI